MAQHSDNPESKALLLEMAQKWRELADRSDSPSGAGHE